MSFRLRSSVAGLCLALAAALTLPASAEHGRGHVSLPTSATELAPTFGHGGEQIEGLVTAVDTTAETISVADQRLGTVVVTVDASTVIRHGWTPIPLSAIAIGARIHAKGTPQSGGGFLADAIFVQNNGNAGGGTSGDQNEGQVQGTVKSIDCASNIMTVTTGSGDVIVDLDSSTAFFGKKHAAAVCTDIAVGDTVEIEGTTQSDGSVLAATISFEAPESGGDQGNGVEGTIKSIDCGSNTMTVTTESGDVVVTFDSATVFSGGEDDSTATCASLAVGDDVEIEGTTQTDGSVLAAKVKFDSGDDQGDNETQVEGTVKSFDCGSNTMTVTTDSGDVVVDFDTNTLFFTNDAASSCADLAVGDAVEVEGTGQTDGSVLAAKVKFQAPEPVEAEVEGTIGTIDTTAQTFVLATDQGNVTIDTDSSTIIREGDTLKTFGDLASGMQVEVEGILQSDGSVLASKISIDDQGDDGSGD